MKNISTLPKNPRSRALHCVLIAAVTASFIGTAAMAGEAQLSVANVSVPEGNSGTTQMNFSVVRSGDTSSNIVVPYSVLPGTAKANKDYVRPANNTLLRIPAGFTQGIVSVPVVGDAAVEPDETLQLQLGRPTAYDPQATLPVAPAYVANRAPTSLVSADFNGDGVADIAVTNEEPISQVVSVLLGRRQGGFGEPSTFSVHAARPSALAVADFNGDGVPDLVMVNNANAEILLLLGNGNGRFREVRNFRVGPSPSSIAVADFNADGRPDLAVAYSISQSVSILLGDGSGRFPIKSEIAVSGYRAGISIVSADFNRDGRLDLAVVGRYFNGEHGTDAVAILLGNGDGSFSSAKRYVVGRPVGFLVSGDFDNDGITDLVNRTETGFSLVKGNRHGGFGPPTEFLGRQINHIAVGEFNGDGNLDLALIDSGVVSIRLGNGNGDFDVARDFVAGYGPQSVLPVDLNRDGKSDLAVTNSNGGVSVLLGNGDGSFAGVRAFPVAGLTVPLTAPYALIPADIDGDGVIDLVAMHRVAAILRGIGDGTFAPATIVDSFNEDCCTLTDAGNVGDFNGDGAPDLVFYSNGNNNVIVFLNNGTGGFDQGKRSPAGLKPVKIVAVDMNVDGKLDLVVANYNLNPVNPVSSVSVLLGNGAGGFAEPITYSVELEGAYALTTADFNSDGKPDIATAGSVLLGDGLGSFVSSNAFPTNGSNYEISAADLNSDGIPDLILSRQSTSYVSILLGVGDGTFRPGTNFELIYGNEVVAIDYNGDGNRDLEFSGFRLSVLLGDSNGGFGAQSIFGYVGTGAICAADFNGDGKRDLAVAALGDNIAVLLNSATNTVVLSNSSATGTIRNDD